VTNTNSPERVKQLEDALLSIELSALSTKKVLTLPECSKYTGLQPSYIYKLTAQRLIPHYKPFGRTIYFNLEEINNWLLSNPVKTLSDTQREANNYLLQSA
jgi:excisionase family DNA binding protein